MMYRKKRIVVIGMVLLAIMVNLIYGTNHYAEAEQGMSQGRVTVLVNLNGGNINGNTEFALVGRAGEQVILEKPVYEGYQFINYRCFNGTLTVDKNGNAIYTFGNTNTVIVAVWEKEMLQIPQETPVSATKPAVQVTAIVKETENPDMEVVTRTETPDVTEEVPQTEEPMMTEGVPQTEEPMITEKMLQTEEPVMTEEVSQTEEPSIIEEVPQIEETPAIEEVLRTEEPDVIEEMFQTESPSAIEKVSQTALPQAIEQPNTKEQNQDKNNIPSAASNFKETIAMNKTKLHLEKTIYYAGYKNKIKPNITITYHEKKLKANKDYIVIYNQHSSYGKNKITVKGIGNYKGKVIKNYYVLPAKTKIIKCELSSKNNGRIIKIKWKKLKGVDGYQILYTTKAKKGFKEISRKSNGETKAAFWFLGKAVYIKVRPYVMIGGTCRYGESSDEKAIKIK